MKVIKNIFSLYLASVLLLFCTESVKAQSCSEVTKPEWEWNSHSNWFFGNGILADFGTSGMEFSNTTSATATHLGYEGTSTVSDDNGNLLYYTNGVNIWGANNVILNHSVTSTPCQLLAGTENGVTTGTSSNQGVMFVKHPQNQTKIYVFTNDDQKTSTKNGFNVWEINTLNHEVTGPTRLVDEYGNDYATGEHMDATFASNGIDIWIATVRSYTDDHITIDEPGTKYIYAYKIDVDKVINTPVLTELPPEKIDGTDYLFQAYSSEDTYLKEHFGDRGSLNFSGSGSKAAITFTLAASGNFRCLTVFDFNSCTGEFENKKAVGGIENSNLWVYYSWFSKPGTYDLGGCYSAVFSPDEKGIYVNGFAKELHVENADYINFFYLDLSSNDEEQINTSLKPLFDFSGYLDGWNQIKIGPDGKMYICDFDNGTLYKVSGDLNNPYDQNNIIALEVTPVANLPAGSSTGRGFPNMFIPPSEFVDEIELNFPQSVSVCSEPLTIEATWACSGITMDNSCGVWTIDGSTPQWGSIIFPNLLGAGSYNISFEFDGNTYSKQLEITNDAPCQDDIDACSQMAQPSYLWKTHSNWFFGSGNLIKFDDQNISFDDMRMGIYMSSYEGNATFSDNNGNLQYFSNGRYLWTRDGDKADGYLLAGSEHSGLTNYANSAVQGVLAVRHPENQLIGHLFTVDDQESTVDHRLGYNHSTINFVTGEMTDPVRLKDDAANDFITTEHQAATLSANGSDIWVTTSESNTVNNKYTRKLLAYKLTKTGIPGPPVASTIEPIKYVDLQGVTRDYEDLYQDRGALNFSWDGSKAVVCSYTEDAKFRSIVLLDFNNCTGEFTNQRNLGAVQDVNGFYEDGSFFFNGVYDIEFSPDGNGVYFTGQKWQYFVNSPVIMVSEGVHFMNISLPTEKAMINSVELILSLTDREADIKLGPNGKLYVSEFNKTFLHELSGDLNSPFGTSNPILSTLTPSTITWPIGDYSGGETGRGLSNMYIPPVVDKLEIDESFLDAINNGTPITVCSHAFQLSVINSCSNTASSACTGWIGNGITDAVNGFFDPSVAGVGNHVISLNIGNTISTITIPVIDSDACTPIQSCDCEKDFKPTPNEEYVISAWVKQGTDINVDEYANAAIELYFDGNLAFTFYAKGPIVDGWQRINQTFKIPMIAKDMKIELVNKGNENVWFDDIRFQPFNSSMVTYVYDPYTFQLVAELDDENFKTEYIYDQDGNLIRTNVETEDGVRTISESRSHVQVRPPEETNSTNQSGN
jgi:YD repeat-containing protein